MPRSLLLLAFAFTCFAASIPDRIVIPVDPTRTIPLTGNTPRQAKPQFDRGPADPALPMKYVLLMVKPSSAQQSELEQLLADQQNPSSPRYRQWLTPEQFGDRFGLSPADHSKVAAWLSGAGFTIEKSARGRNWIAFSGTAALVNRAFHTSIDRFEVDGAMHYANASDPAVPEALTGVIGGFQGLSDFRPRPMVHAIADYNSGSSHFLAPQDWQTIYDVTPLYTAGYQGAGQSIVVVGQSDVPASDISGFRSHYGLAANSPKMMLYGGADPGYTDAQIEGDLDLEWAGAIAPQATIDYVYGQDAFTAMVAAIDLNIAPVITVSYSGCEVQYPLNYWRSVAQQANSQGITILNASGDSGPAGCDGGEDVPFAVSGEVANFPAVLPEVTAVGGTEFVEGAGTYWATTNSATSGSALSYIPEAAWNETNSQLLATGGGASVLYAKPLWQTGPGVPNDNARDVPDVAFSAAAHDGYAIIYNGVTLFVSGTSCSSPAFAGVMALLNQYEIAQGFQSTYGQGNINPQLYRIAQIAPAAFHDVTSGNNIVNCAQGSPNCLTGSYGFTAVKGYDQATGLGSIDANQLVTRWQGESPTADISLYLNTTRATLNDTVGMTATVTPGIIVFDCLGVCSAPIPSGTVAFSVGGIALGTVPLASVSGQQEATLFFPAYLFQGVGTYSIVAQYSGDATFSSAGTTRTIQIIVPSRAAAIVPNGPDTVWAAAPDAQGLSWSTTFSLRELAGVAALITGFSLDGAPRPLAQYFPSPTIPANGSVSTNVVLRNLQTPSVHSFVFTGTDVDGNSWTRQLSVNYLALGPGAAPLLTAAPLVVNQDPNADPDCQWPFQLHLDENGGFVGLDVTRLLVGNVDYSSRISTLFGTVRLAPWEGLTGTICLDSGIAPPASEVVQVEVGGMSQELTVSLAAAVANPATLAATLKAAAAAYSLGSTQVLYALSIDVSDPTASWSASVYPHNRTTAWLGASQFSGAGSGYAILTASPAGFEPGAYRANVVVQCPTCAPQTVTVPLMFVNGPNSTEMAIQSVENPATFTNSVSPGMVIAIFGANLANTTATAAGNPLPYTLGGVSATVNGIAAPLAYVSSTQVNLQIPYEAGAGPSVLGINNSGQIAGFQFQIAPTAPGIFTDGNGNISPVSTVGRGATTSLYLAGGGEVTGELASAYATQTGTPITEYVPQAPVSVTVGGVPAFVKSVGLTPNFVGLMQVTFILPSAVGSGVQPVVVTVGGVASPPANLTVQ